MDPANINDVMNLSWGGPSYASYEGQLNSAAVTPGTADTGSQPTGGTAEGAPAASPAADGKAASSTAGPNEDNIRQLRTSHEELTGKWQKLGDYEKVSSAVQQFTKFETEATETAKALGYDADDFTAAWQKDPIKVIQILRQEAAEAEKRGDPDGSGRRIEDLVNRRVQDAIKPITEQHNQQLTEKANNLFQTTVSELIKTDYADAPKEVNEFLSDMVSEILKYDSDGLKALKMEGKTAPVQAAYKIAKDMWLRAVNSYIGWQQNKAPNSGGNAGGGNAKAPKLTLDDIIDGNANATKQMSTFK